MKPLDANNQPDTPVLRRAPGARTLFIAALGFAVIIGVVAEQVGLAHAAALPLAAALATYALCNYQAALWLSAFVLPLASTYLLPSKMLGISGFSPMNIIVALPLLALLLHLLLHRKKLHIPPWPPMFFLFVFLFLAGGIHGAFYATSIPSYFLELNVTTASSVPAYLLEALLKPLEMLGIVYMLSIGVRNAVKPELFLVPVFLSAACIAGAILYVAASSPLPLAELSSQQNRNYLSGIGMHANELGLLLNMATALVLACLAGCRGRMLKIALGILSAVLACAVVLTFSRGAYLGLFSVIIFSLVVQRRLNIAGVLIFLVIAGAAFNPSPVSERAAQGIESSDPDAISSGRLKEIWLPLLPEIRNSPLIGHGLSSILWSQAARERQILPVGHPHSAFLGAVLDVGVLGSMLIGLFFVHMWRLFRGLGKHANAPLWRSFFSGAMACILLLLVQGVTDDSFLPTRTQPFLWLAYGYAVALYARQKENSSRRGGT